MASPPIYYPGTFSRNDAKQITFDKGQKKVDNIDILCRKKAVWFSREPSATRPENRCRKPSSSRIDPTCSSISLPPIPTHKGITRSKAWATGEFLVHVDAVHRGFVRKRTPIDLDKTNSENATGLHLGTAGS